ncbi:hypothetical protein G7046_g2130 [Stylonectria norvegica]|nr:hypothetical protein G7046_g2130 [Stylonectria norvegica]
MLSSVSPSAAYSLQMQMDGVDVHAWWHQSKFWLAPRGLVGLIGAKPRSLVGFRERPTDATCRDIQRWSAVAAVTAVVPVLTVVLTFQTGWPKFGRLERSPRMPDAHAMDVAASCKSLRRPILETGQSAHTLKVRSAQFNTLAAPARVGKGRLS